MIDLCLFEHQFQRFEEHVMDKSGLDFISFSSNPYTEKEEGYKYDIYRNARKLLKFETWRESDIGESNITRSVIAATELTDNNLVQWQAKFGGEKRPHHLLHTALEDPSSAEAYDSSFYDLYRKSNDLNVFENLVGLLGRKYALIAYPC
jgi:hypothetical protein